MKKNLNIVLGSLLLGCMNFSAGAAIITVNADGGFTGFSGDSSVEFDGSGRTVNGNTVYAGTTWGGGANRSF